MSENPLKVPALLIKDMLISIDDIFEFTNSMTLEQFQGDKKTRAAVVRGLEIIGEAANRLPKSIKELNPEIEWNRIIRSRHILIHEYSEVDYEVIWRIVTVHLPVLEKALAKLLLTLE